MADATVVATLPTSKNNAPSLIDITHGCVNINERKFNCYVFEEKRCICDNGFSFHVHTYVYGNQVESYSLDSISLNLTIKEGVNFTIKGVLTKHEFESIKNCIINSDSTVNRIKKLLRS